MFRVANYGNLAFTGVTIVNGIQDRRSRDAGNTKFDPSVLTEKESDSLLGFCKIAENQMENNGIDGDIRLTAKKIYYYTDIGTRCYHAPQSTETKLDGVFNEFFLNPLLRMKCTGKEYGVQPVLYKNGVPVTDTKAAAIPVSRMDLLSKWLKDNVLNPKTEQQTEQTDQKPRSSQERLCDYLG